MHTSTNTLMHPQAYILYTYTYIYMWDSCTFTNNRSRSMTYLSPSTSGQLIQRIFITSEQWVAGGREVSIVILLTTWTNSSRFAILCADFHITPQLMLWYGHSTVHKGWKVVYALLNVQTTIKFRKIHTFPNITDDSNELLTKASYFPHPLQHSIHSKL